MLATEWALVTYVKSGNTLSLPSVNNNGASDEVAHKLCQRNFTLLTMQWLAQG